MDYVNLVITHPFLMLWAGQFLHMLKEVKEVETQVPGVTIGLYIKRHRYGVTFSAIAGLVVYAILFQMGELSPLSAFMAGYMSESVINAAASRVTRKVSGDEFGIGSYFGGTSNFEEGKPYDYYDWYKNQDGGGEVGSTTPAPDGEPRPDVLEGEGARGEGADGDRDRGVGKRRTRQRPKGRKPSHENLESGD